MAALPHRLFRIFLISCLFAVSSQSVIKQVTRVRDRIYVKLESNQHCFRILNATHQVGCHSAEKGSYGVLQMIESEADYEYVKKDPGNHGPFIAGMGIDWFWKKEKVMKVMSLYKSGKVNGMLVFLLDEESTGSFPFSEDVECPNENSGLDKEDKESCKSGGTPWNVDAHGYRFMDFNIPIALIYNKTEETLLRKMCYEQHNFRGNDSYPEYPLCSVELLLFNVAAGSAVRCNRRSNMFTGLENPQKLCDPMKDHNLFAFLPATNKSRPFSNNSVLMLASRMDSLSMFSDYDPGAASSLGNVILMLTIAEVLGRNTNKEFLVRHSANTGKYLMLVLFNGEALDYIGSSRMVYDIEKEEFPVKLDDATKDQPALLSLNNLALILEFNQVAMADPNYFFHVDPNSMKNPQTKAVVENATAKLLKISSDNSSSIFSSNIDWNMRLPPASVQRFLMVNRSIPALVITDHAKNFTNRRYNSFTDKPINFDLEKAKKNMIDLANALSKFMFEWISDGQLPSEEVDEKFEFMFEWSSTGQSSEGSGQSSEKVDENGMNWKVNETVMDYWMECFWGPNFTCPVLDRFHHFVKDFNETYRKHDTQYKRTYIGPSMRYLSMYLEHSMAYLLGKRYPMPKDDSTKCDNTFTNRTGELYSYDKMVDLFDFENSTNQNFCIESTVSTSKALSPAFEIEDYDFNSGQYSTWMESVWQSTHVRIFLCSSSAWQGGVLGIGMAVMLFSVLVVYGLSARSDIIFTNEIAP